MGGARRRQPRSRSRQLEAALLLPPLAPSAGAEFGAPPWPAAASSHTRCHTRPAPRAPQAVGPCGAGSRRRCLFLTTERLGAVFVFDITNPALPAFQSLALPPQVRARVPPALPAARWMDLQRGVLQLGACLPPRRPPACPHPRRPGPNCASVQCC